jgi:hypothetical protein
MRNVECPHRNVVVNEATSVEAGVEMEGVRASVIKA